MTVTPFTVAIPEADLDMMRRRIRETRWADDWNHADWSYGVERDWLRGMADYWADGFDWRAQERAINQWPQFIADVDGYAIHFIHVKGKGPNPRPPHPDPWLALDLLGLEQADRSAHRSGSAWRRSRRCARR